jgi:enoyl-CoA hydratase/carnithine racemase
VGSSADEHFPIAVIVVMHGFTIGLGIDLASCCDIRICSSDVKFAVKEVDIGLAADVGTLSRLPKIVGNSSWVKEVCLTARTFGAQEAKEVGFVYQIASTKEDALKKGLDMAELIAGKSPVAVQGTKEILNYSREHNVADGKDPLLPTLGHGLTHPQVFATQVFGIRLQCSQPTFSEPCSLVSKKRLRHLRNCDSNLDGWRHQTYLDLSLS